MRLVITGVHHERLCRSMDSIFIRSLLSCADRIIIKSNVKAIFLCSLCFLACILTLMQETCEVFAFLEKHSV